MKVKWQCIWIWIMDGGHSTVVQWASPLLLLGAGTTSLNTIEYISYTEACFCENLLVTTFICRYFSLCSLLGHIRWGGHRVTHFFSLFLALLFDRSQVKGRASWNTLILCVFLNENLYRRQRLGSVIKTRRYLHAVGFRISCEESKICYINHYINHIVKPLGSLWKVLSCSCWEETHRF